MESVRKFLQTYSNADILVLNTGGPPVIEFKKISEEDWNNYHNQLFLGFCTILQQISINDNGYIFVITSNVIKEPSSKLIISSAYRAAFASVFKILSKEFAKRQISCINIAPGPINTDRTKELIDNVDEFVDTLPMKRLGEPEEIGEIIAFLSSEHASYITGSVIPIDGGLYMG